MLGAIIAGRVLKPEAAGWSRRTTALLTAVGVTMTAVAVVLFAHAPHAGDPVTLIITGALAIAMGLQAATARHLSVKDVTTVVAVVVGSPGPEHRHKILPPRSPRRRWCPSAERLGGYRRSRHASDTTNTTAPSPSMTNTISPQFAWVTPLP